MRRGLFFFERFLQVGGRMPWNVLLAVRAGGPLDAGRLRAALDRVQLEHPMLRVAVVPHRRRPHFEPAVRPIALRTAEEGWFDVVRNELEHPFDRSTGPLLRAVRVPDPDGDVLVLVGDHGICDGRAMLQLAREVLGWLDPGPPMACVPRRGFGCLEELFPARTRLGMVARAGAIGWLLRGAGDVAKALRRLHPPVRARSPAYVLRWEMPEALSARLQARAAAEAATPYTALATALLRAMRTVRGAESRNRLLCPVDIRAQVPGLAPDMLFGFPGTVRLSVDRALDGRFWAQVRALRDELRVRKAGLDPARMLKAAERLHGISDWFVTLQLHGRARNDLMFSYLGEAGLPARRSCAPDTVLAFLASMPWRGATAVFALRDGGRMRFCLVSREEILPQAQAGRVRDEVMARLGAVLGAQPG